MQISWRRIRVRYRYSVGIGWTSGNRRDKQIVNFIHKNKSNLPLCSLITKMKCEWITKQCRIQLFKIKNMKKYKTEQQEEPAVLDTINTIALLKINNEMKLTFVLVYCNGAMFSGIINNCVIIFNNDVVSLRCIGWTRDQCIVNM